MTNPPEALASMLARLGLRALAADLDDVLAQAAKARWSPLQLLEHVTGRDVHRICSTNALAPTLLVSSVSGTSLAGSMIAPPK